MRIRLILVLAASVLAAPLAAQQPASPIARSEEAVVTFTVSGRVSGARPGLSQVSTILLQKASADPRLASLTVEQEEHRADARLHMAFVFASEAEFRAWYESQSTRELLDLVTRSTGTPSFSLDFKRFPLANMIRVSDRS